MESQSLLSQFSMWLGPYKWPMIILSLLVAVLIIKKLIELLIPGVSMKQKTAGINAILFWGGVSLALGIFSQTVSLWVALQEIIKAADISPVIVLIGFYGSFVSTMFGALTLIVAALAWWLFRTWVRRISPVS